MTELNVARNVSCLRHLEKEGTHALILTMNCEVKICYRAYGTGFDALSRNKGRQRGVSKGRNFHQFLR